MDDTREGDFYEEYKNEETHGDFPDKGQYNNVGHYGTMKKSDSDPNLMAYSDGQPHEDEVHCPLIKKVCIDILLSVVKGGQGNHEH